MLPFSASCRFDLRRGRRRVVGHARRSNVNVVARRIPSQDRATKSPQMAKDAFDRWWEWVEKPVESAATIRSHFYGAVMRLSPGRRRDRTAVNEAIRLADPDAQRLP